VNVQVHYADRSSAVHVFVFWCHTCLQIAAALVAAGIPVLLLDMIVASLDGSTAVAAATNSTGVVSAQQHVAGATASKPQVGATQAMLYSVV
jgi:purine-cytosine permease-like protein